MNRKLLVILIGLIAAVLTAAGVWFVNDIFPKAPPITDILPTAEMVDTIQFAVEPDELFPADIDVNKLLSLLAKAVPTRTQSMDDYPHVRPFYIIEVQTKPGDSSSWHQRYCLYESGEKVYLEIPYGGVYTVDRELWNLVTAYFEE